MINLRKRRSVMISLVAAGLLALAAIPGIGGAADHLDAPGLTSPGSDGRLDINDLYAFQSPTHPENTVLIMTVNPAAGVLSPTTFHPDAKYEFLIDTDGDAKGDSRYRVTFGEVIDGNQSIKLREIGAGGGKVLAQGWVGDNIRVRDGGWLRAGVFDDPFFFDLVSFLDLSFCSGDEFDFFAGLNVAAIVIEVPSESLGPDNIGVWVRTKLDGAQIDRMGRPAINTVFIPNNPIEPAGTEPSLKNEFNAGKPKHDQRDFRGEVVDTLLALGNDEATANALADVLLPDILTVDTSSSAGFLNGRGLADDVIDAELGLITGGAIGGDCVDANNVAFPGVFPYLAAKN